MQRGVEILGKLLFDKLQLTEKGDRYVTLFSLDCKELISKALKQVRSEVDDEFLG
jgi:hypothetical protein